MRPLTLNLIIQLINYSIIDLSLQRFGLLRFRSGSCMKREPGANPGQTRCCKLHNQKPKYSWSLSFNDGKTGLRRSESEDLPDH